jgi:hypothetical protein
VIFVDSIDPNSHTIVNKILNGSITQWLLILQFIDVTWSYKNWAHYDIPCKVCWNVSAILSSRKYTRKNKLYMSRQSYAPVTGRRHDKTIIHFVQKNIADSESWVHEIDDQWEIDDQLMIDTWSSIIFNTTLKTTTTTSPACMVTPLSVNSPWLDLCEVVLNCSKILFSSSWRIEAAEKNGLC